MTRSSGSTSDTDCHGRPTGDERAALAQHREQCQADAVDLAQSG
jgi:hypothetical protein